MARHSGAEQYRATVGAAAASGTPCRQRSDMHVTNYHTTTWHWHNPIDACQCVVGAPLSDRTFLGYSLCSALSSLSSPSEDCSDSSGVVLSSCTTSDFGTTSFFSFGALLFPFFPPPWFFFGAIIHYEFRLTFKLYNVLIQVYFKFILQILCCLVVDFKNAFEIKPVRV